MRERRKERSIRLVWIEGWAENGDRRPIRQSGKKGIHRGGKIEAVVQCSQRTKGLLSLMQWLLRVGHWINMHSALSSEEEFLNITRGLVLRSSRLEWVQIFSWEDINRVERILSRLRHMTATNSAKLFIWVKGGTNKCIIFKPLQRKPLDYFVSIFR